MRRATTRLAGLFMLLLGGGVLAYGITDLTTLMRGFGDDRAVVVAEPYAASAILLGLFGLAVALVFLFAKPTEATPRRRGPPSGSERWSGPFFLALLGCLVFALLSPIIQSFIVTRLAASRGYVRCPEIEWPRHQPDRWAHATSVEHCPSEGASPDR